MRRSLPYIHSTFRDGTTGHQIVPSGLQWSLPGVSHVRFVLPPGDDATPTRGAKGIDTHCNEFRFGLVQAYNRWCVAKDWDHHFKSASDIESVVTSLEHHDDRPQHYQVHWKDTTQHSLERMVRHQDIGHLLRQSLVVQESKDESCSPVEVWIQGHYHGPLQADTVDDVIASIPSSENRLEFKQSRGQIRIERYYRGMLRQNQVWDHIWDNLVALEDPQVLAMDDSKTITIGTATLKDWVVGGTLTSRLWIQEEEDRILFLRPLYHDDPATSDRRYELTRNQHETNPMVEERMAMVRQELERFRYLATLEHPYVTGLASTLQQSAPSSHDAKIAKIREKLGHGRRKRKFFGL